MTDRIISSDQQAHFDLGGEWQLVLDPHNEGLNLGWAAGHFPLEKSKTVILPALWNLIYPDYEGVAFYRKTFSAPEDWGTQVALLQTDGICYKTDIWLNGSFLGFHEGAYTGFGIDISGGLRAGGENELVLRVAGLSKTKPVDGLLLHQAPASKQTWYFTHAGPWGKIWIERRPSVYIRSLVLEPDLRREKVLVEVVLFNTRPQVQETVLHIHVSDPHGEPAVEISPQVVAQPGATRHSFNIPIPRPLPWTCDTPHLYQARVSAAGPDGWSDVAADRFGMRDFTLSNGQFILNGEPVFIRGILLQPHYPVTQVVPPDPEMMRREITLMKEAGFNLIRCHIRPAPPGYLDITDEMGMLVYAETSLAWIRESPRIREHGEREIRALIERDRNHASVVIWGLLNENPPASADYSEYFMRCARSIDPTRVVLDNSGGSLAFDQDFGWIDRAYALADRETAPQKVLDIHTYLGNYLSHGVYEWVRTLGTGASHTPLLAGDYCSSAVLEEFEREVRDYRGRIFFSELGGGGMADLEADLARYGEQVDLVDAKEIAAFYDSLTQGFHERKLGQIFGTLKNMAAAAQALQAGGDVRQLEAVLTNPRLSGYVLTQLNDLSWEFHGGLLDTWRSPKPVYHAVKRVNRSFVLVLKAASPVVSCSSQAEVSIRLAAFAAPPEGAEVVVEICGPESEWISKYRWPILPVKGVQEIALLCPQTGAMPGCYTLDARFEHEGRILAETQETFLALAPVELPELQETRDWLLSVPDPGALPYKEWQTHLSEARAGKTVLLGPLSMKDQNAIDALREAGLSIELDYGIGSWSGCYHWVPDSPLFAELPCGGFAGEAYMDVLPTYCLGEQGGQVLAGAVRSKHVVGADSLFHWYSDIEVKPYGQGRLVFCQYRLLDKLAAHPLARTLFKNLVTVLGQNHPRAYVVD